MKGPRKPLIRSPLRPGTPPKRKVSVKRANPERQAKRRRRYHAALRSAHWKALRRQVFREQDGLCVCGHEPMTVLDHKTYARLGHELREDVQGLGAVCNARETTLKRANWASPRWRSSRGIGEPT